MVHPVELKAVLKMWSNRFFYLNIVFDLKLSTCVKTTDLNSFLITQPELIQVSDFKFRNAPDFPVTMEIQLLHASDYTSWSDQDVSHESTNMVSIVCTKSGLDSNMLAKKLFVEIARFLNWQLIDEHTDDGIENHILWKPS